MKLKIPLKWPENLIEFGCSIKNFREDKNFSEQNLFDEIVRDVNSNYTFTKGQIQKVRELEDDLNKLEEQRAVLGACGEILAEQNIQPK